MRFAAASMVRNEADIVEAFVRHNLRLVERLAIVDHASDDGTADILDALAREGLPITVTRDDDPAHRQQETLTRLARELLRDGFGLVFALDADEFLKIPDPALLAEGVASLPPGLNVGVPWQTYVPAQWLEKGANPLAAATRRREHERHGLIKVAVTQAFLQATDTIIGPGSHAVLRVPQMAMLPVARVVPHVAALAHLPVRSAAQLVAKVRTGWAAHVAARRDNPHLAYHWRELSDEFATGTLPTPERLATIAANYSLKMESWEDLAAIPLVDDPLPAVELRYT